MELEISIELRDRNIGQDLFETRQPKVGQEKIIAEGVSIQIKNYYARDAVDLATILNIVAYIGERIALPIAVTVLSEYLYDKLKDKKNSRLMINHIPVEINVEKIEKLIIEITEKDDSE